MDAALRLRMLVDSGAPLQEGEADAMLAGSSLVQRVTAERVEGALPSVWRLVALAEIPHAERLPYTQELAERTISTLGTAHGFSLTGRADDLLPCYNAMLVRALTRLGFAARPEAAAAVGWILQHQPLDRSWRTSWSGRGIHKYGGCLEATPCYIGLVKAVKALQAYEHATGEASAGAGGTRAGEVRRAIDTGVEYILDHRLYLRASREEPITGHLLDVSFPESYHLNLLEMLAVIDAAGRLHDPRCRQALDHLASRRSETTGSWKVSFRYTGKGWVAFDPAGQPAEWVTYLAQRFLTRGQADQRGQAEQADHPPDA